MPMTSDPGDRAPQRRTLGTLDATVLVVASVVGVGIFLTPAGVAALAPTPAWYFGLWACGGAIALAGALSYAELGAALDTDLRPASLGGEA